MPFADREHKLAYMREWRERKMKEGYGVWLYKRRKLRFDNEVRFREALDRIASMNPGIEEDPAAQSVVEEVSAIAREALEVARAAEEELGEFNTPEGSSS